MITFWMYLMAWIQTYSIALIMARQFPIATSTQNAFGELWRMADIFWTESEWLSVASSHQFAFNPLPPKRK